MVGGEGGCVVGAVVGEDGVGRAVGLGGKEVASSQSARFTPLQEEP